MTLREVITREFEPVRMPMDEAVRWALENVRMRPGFRELVELARARGWRVVVVSSGFHELIEPMLESEGVEAELYANRADPRPDGWRAIWRYDDQNCECAGRSASLDRCASSPGTTRSSTSGTAFPTTCGRSVRPGLRYEWPRALPRRARRVRRALRRLPLDRGEPRASFEVEIKGVPNEESLRDLVHAREAGADKIVLETTHEAGDAWIRAGFHRDRACARGASTTRAPPRGPQGAVVRLDSGAERRRRGRRPRSPPYVPRLPGGSQGASSFLRRRAGRPSTTSSATASRRCSGGLRRRSPDRMGSFVIAMGVEEGRWFATSRSSAAGWSTSTCPCPSIGSLPRGEVIALGANPRPHESPHRGRPGRGSDRAAHTAKSAEELPAARRVAGRARACVPHPARGLRIRPRSQRRRSDRDRAVVTQVLLLHAFPLDARMWSVQREALEGAGYDVVTLDLPGLDADIGFDVWARRVLGEVEGDFIPVGISMGGYLAFELWRQDARRIPDSFWLTRARRLTRPRGSRRATTRSGSWERTALIPLGRSRAEAVCAFRRSGCGRARPSAGCRAGDHRADRRLMTLRDRADLGRRLRRSTSRPWWWSAKRTRSLRRPRMRRT